MKKARLKINYNSCNYKSIIYTKGTILTYINNRYQINDNDTFGLVNEFVESNPDIFEVFEKKSAEELGLEAGFKVGDMVAGQFGNLFKIKSFELRNNRVILNLEGTNHWYNIKDVINKVAIHTPTKEAAEKWIEDNSKLYLGDIEVEIIKSRIINTSNFLISSTSSLLQNCYSYKVYTDKGQVYTTDWLKWYDKLINAKQVEGVNEIKLILGNSVKYETIFHPNSIDKYDNSIGCIKNVKFEQIEKITNKIKEILK